MDEFARLIVLMAIAKYGPAALAFMFQPVPSMGGPAKAFPPDFGYDLWVAYVVWIATPASLSAAWGESRAWSMRMPLFRCQAPAW